MITLGKFTCKSVDTSGDEPMLILHVRHWLRWRTEKWVGRKTPDNMVCSACKINHRVWARISDGECVPCVQDRQLDRLLYARIHGPLEPLMPDNVVPLHRGGVYR